MTTMQNHQAVAPIGPVQHFFEFLESATALEGNWSIERDEHRTNYESVAELLERQDYLWESQSEKVRAIQKNRMVSLHWYDQTPVGSYKLAAPDLEALARFVTTEFKR